MVWYQFEETHCTNLIEFQLSLEHLMHLLIFQSFFLYPFLYLQVTDQQNKSFVNYKLQTKHKYRKMRCNYKRIKHIFYFNSTVAPAPSSFSLIESASSLATPVLTLDGAPSTNSLASFRPNPVMALSSLIT